MPQVFETEQWLPFPRELVFAFFANPKNLPPLMPRWQHARIETATYRPPPPRPQGTPIYPGVAAGAGTTLTITARGAPFLPLRGAWDALIEDFRWNEGFCDVQLRGPFAYWRHCHTVRDAPSPPTGSRAQSQTGAPGTMIHHHVTYTLPLDPVSRVAIPTAQVAMAAMFHYRQARAAELLPVFAQQARQVLTP